MLKQTPIIASSGRLLIALIFLISGLGKISAQATAIGYINAVHLPFPWLAFISAVVIEIWRFASHQVAPAVAVTWGPARQLSRLKVPAPEATSWSNPPAIEIFFKKFII
jgi:hypothetical protein